MDFKALLMGLAFALMWSSAFTSARIIVAEAPPMMSLALRFFISGCVGILIARAMGQNWSLTRGQWRSVVIFGVCQNALYLGLFFVAMQWIDASLAAIIASTMPLMVAAANWVVFKENLPLIGTIGMVAGFLGVAMIMGQRLQGGADSVGVLICVIGVIALSIATMAMKSTKSGGNVMMIVGLQILVGSFVLMFPAVAFETWDVTFSWRLAAAFTYTIFVPGLAATYVWFLLVERIGATRGATFHFLNPFFGVAIAALFLGEGFSALDMLGVAVVMIGILAVQLSKQKTS
ncbi:MAG: DMT family transporter [Paracoccaceae bacterium]|nr:DMT family transporter [Paracoccaceae bacterium]